MEKWLRPGSLQASKQRLRGQGMQRSTMIVSQTREVLQFEFPLGGRAATWRGDKVRECPQTTRSSSPDEQCHNVIMERDPLVECSGSSRAHERVVGSLRLLSHRLIIQKSKSSKLSSSTDFAIVHSRGKTALVDHVGSPRVAFFRSRDKKLVPPLKKSSA